MKQGKLMTQGIFISFLFLFFILSSSFLVSAVPPVTEAFAVQEDGIQIQLAALDTFQVGGNGAGVIHVFNNSNGAILTSTTNPSVSCEAHLMNRNGSIKFEQIAVPNGDNFIVTYNQTDILQAGIYPYTIHCNTTEGYGAYITSKFEATDSGTNGVYNATAMILILIVVAYLLIGVGIKGEEFVPIVFGAFILFGVSLYTYQNGLGAFAKDTLPIYIFTLVNVGIACYVSFKGIFEYLINGQSIGG